jgi:signal transduction histidine kinase
MAPPAVDADALARKLAGFPSLGVGVAHELTNPLVVIVTNATMVAGELAALRARLPAGDPLGADVDELAAAQADILAAAERLEALARALRTLR